MRILLLFATVMSPPSNESDVAPTLAQRIAGSSTFDDLLCAESLELVEPATVERAMPWLHTNLSDKEFTELEAKMRDILNRAKFAGRASFTADDVIESDYFPRLSRREWFGSYLRAMREPEVSRVQQKTYRFLWLRSFHPPISVRVYRAGDDTYLVAKMLSGAGGYQPAPLCARIGRKLAREETARVQRCFAKPEVWQPVKGDRRGKDGAQWILERNVDGKYLFAQQWTPDDSWLRECALEMLQMSGLPIEPVY